MLTAFLLTVAAGSATLLGALVALHPKMVGRSVMAVALGFAGGAMLFLSIAEVLPTSISELEGEYGQNAIIMGCGAFVVGLIIMFVVDKLFPHKENTNHHVGIEEPVKDDSSALSLRRLRRSGILIAAAIGLHNFSEGLVTFIGAVQSTELGITLAIAIAIHNVPVGIAIASPIYAATRSAKRAFSYAALAGLAGPIGALLGFLLIDALVPVAAFGVVLAAIAGLMTYICLDELLPAAKRYATGGHHALYGTAAGMGVMAVSLALF